MDSVPSPLPHDVARRAASAIGIGARAMGEDDVDATRVAEWDLLEKSMRASDATRGAAAAAPRASNAKANAKADVEASRRRRRDGEDDYGERSGGEEEERRGSGATRTRRSTRGRTQATVAVEGGRRRRPRAKAGAETVEIAVARPREVVDARTRRGTGEEATRARGGSSAQRAGEARSRYEDGVRDEFKHEARRARHLQVFQ